MKYVHEGPNGAPRSRREYSAHERHTHAPFRAALYAAVIDEWWTAFLDMWFDIATQIATDSKLCTECGEKVGAMKACRACNHPVGGHLDALADESPLVEHVGFDG